MPAPDDGLDAEDDELDIVRDEDGENADLCIDPEVIQGFSDWKDPTKPPPWDKGVA